MRREWKKIGTTGTGGEDGFKRRIEAEEMGMKKGGKGMIGRSCKALNVLLLGGGE